MWPVSGLRQGLSVPELASGMVVVRVSARGVTSGQLPLHRWAVGQFLEDRRREFGRSLFGMSGFQNGAHLRVASMTGASALLARRAECVVAWC